jgi:N-methylhydantoinase A
LLTEAGAEAAHIAYRPTAEMRHVGQGFEIPVPLPTLAPSGDDLAAIRTAFFDSYRARFGRTMEEAPIEALSWRLACIAPGLDIRLGGAGPADGATLDGARRGARDVLFEGHGWKSCIVYDRYKLPVGAAFNGPALIEERESTCVVGPDAAVGVDALRNLVVTLG